MLIHDQETAVDFLNYEAVAKTVVALLKGNSQHALTVGIHGDWGAGKSSVLRMVESGMKGDSKVACLWFNGWTFQGFDDAKTVLIEVIVSELIRQRGAVGKVKAVGNKLLKRLNVMKLARHGLGLAVSLKTGIPPHITAAALETVHQLGDSVKSMSADDIKVKLDEAAALLKPAVDESVPEDVHHFREEFGKLLEEAKIDQLVVLIDDLDRCLPATAIDTLEAIRLFLFVPKTAFIIGADEGMIEYAVRQHFPNLPLASGPLPYARNYLEKLIQIPFRIPALGVQESRTYVTLLLVQAIVGEDHMGFKDLLALARKALNQPWHGSGIKPEQVSDVDKTKREELDAAFVLAQQIGPILAEGTKGNPRQIKRFLNSLAIRLTIAKERGFWKDVNSSVLGKLMLAERFQPDFYDHVAAEAMLAPDGRVPLLAELESAAREDGKAADKKEKGSARAGKSTARADGDNEKWLSREWLLTWSKIDPALAGEDMRPYVFVARDKRILVTAAEASSLDALIESLSGSSDLAARAVEPQVKGLSAGDAEQLFAALRERVLRASSFQTEPSGFTGLMLVAKNHPRHQAEILSLIESIDATTLGPWATRGWKEVLAEPGTTDRLNALLGKWAAQDENQLLKRSATQALAPAKKAGR
ncbi:MAG TPA: Qat anti-phage system ATPase QatA [Vicinamibacterales bacterium]|nr:Qat anti-phage system ATPase QatA [Vicinamibacterales bacterium]